MKLFCWFLVTITSSCCALRLQTEAPRNADQDGQTIHDGQDFQDTLEQALDAMVPGYGNRKEKFEYDFTWDKTWHDADFEEKWSMFQNAVPLSNFQANFDPEVDSHPVCQPSLVGPKGSNKLAILMHGFLACPGLWYRVVPLLVSEGFRVMLPTLPGHGRTWILPGKALNNTVVDLGDDGLVNDGGIGGVPIVNRSAIETDLSDAQDDIENIPSDALPYQIFARTLGQIAAQFKREHPDGLVVVAGHSMGGAITARYAMDIPEVVDRVMLLNPMFGLASSLSQIAAYLTPSMRLSKGSKCERQRGKGSGGQCQFRLAHVRAMSLFASSMLCDDWGVLKDSGCAQPDASGRYDRKFGKMKDFQVVTSRREGAVDNYMIAKFVHDVQSERTQHQGITLNYDPTFCHWPSDLGHSYLSNRKKKSSSEKWWHPYVENAIVDFLVSGKNVEIVRSGDANDCLVESTNVKGRVLTLLPAVQHSEVYLIGTYGYRYKFAQVKFSGDVTKESHGWGSMRPRHMEVLRYDESRALIVTRKHANDNIRNIYDIRKKDLVGITDEKGVLCMVPKVDDVYPNMPLQDALKKADTKRAKGYAPRELHFCGVGTAFMVAVCEMVECAVNAANTNTSVITELLGKDKKHVPSYQL